MRYVKNMQRRDRGVVDEIAGKKAFADGCRFRLSMPPSWRKGYLQARDLASRAASVERGRSGDVVPFRLGEDAGDDTGRRSRLAEHGA